MNNPANAIDRDILAVLHGNNFHLARHTKHLIFRHRSGRASVSVSSSPSGLSKKRVERDIRRALRQAGIPQA
jgi:hypothetical protein